MLVSVCCHEMASWCTHQMPRCYTLEIFYVSSTSNFVLWSTLLVYDCDLLFIPKQNTDVLAAVGQLLQPGSGILNAAILTVREVQWGETREDYWEVWRHEGWDGISDPLHVVQPWCVVSVLCTVRNVTLFWLLWITVKGLFTVQRKSSWLWLMPNLECHVEV